MSVESRMTKGMGPLFMNMVVFLDPVRSRHCSQFQFMWPNAGAGVRLFRSGGQRSSTHIWGNVWQNLRPDEQLEVGQSRASGSSRSLQSVDNQLGAGYRQAGESFS